MNSFKTPKGTELPILKLRGKDYLEVKYRLVWFREERPDWSIETEYLSIGEKSAMAKATIKDATGRILATAHKFETVQGFQDFHEKVETSAIGRALALVGYGTQFCADELDEGSRIVDAPATLPTARPPTSATRTPIRSGSEPGDYVVRIGKKHFGKKLESIDPTEIESFINWLEKSASQTGKPLSASATEFIQAATAHLTALDMQVNEELSGGRR